MFINKVTIYSHALDEMKDFYVTLLGFPLINETVTSFTILIGASELEIQHSNYHSKPFYHFACTIPSNQFKEGKEWAKSKVILNKEDNEDEIFFSNFNAHSIYFMDPSKNIVELISRHSLNTDVYSPFSSDHILNISEINLTTHSVVNVGKQLIKAGLPFREELLKENQLNFVGEKGSYILLGPEQRVWLFSNKKAEIHPIIIEINNRIKIDLNNKGHVICSAF